MPRLEDLAGQAVAGSRAQASAPAAGPDAAIPPDLLAAIGGGQPPAGPGEGDIEGAISALEAQAETLTPDEAAKVRAHLEEIRVIFSGEPAEAAPESPESSAMPPMSAESKEE